MSVNEAVPFNSCLIKSAFKCLLRNGYVKGKGYKTNEIDARYKVENLNFINVLIRTNNSMRKEHFQGGKKIWNKERTRKNSDLGKTSLLFQFYNRF